MLHKEPEGGCTALVRVLFLALTLPFKSKWLFK